LPGAIAGTFAGAFAGACPWGWRGGGGNRRHGGGAVSSPTLGLDGFAGRPDGCRGDELAAWFARALFPGGGFYSGADGRIEPGRFPGGGSVPGACGGGLPGCGLTGGGLTGCGLTGGGLTGGGLTGGGLTGGGSSGAVGAGFAFGAPGRLLRVFAVGYFLASLLLAFRIGGPGRLLFEGAVEERAVGGPRWGPGDAGWGAGHGRRGSRQREQGGLEAHTTPPVASVVGWDWR
jgi:hypothetical protein